MVRVRQIIVYGLRHPIDAQFISASKSLFVNFVRRVLRIIAADI
jgi:hypothetical protein